MTDTTTTPAIYAAITAVMKGIGTIGKDRKNLQQGYNFRGIDDVYNALHEPLAKAGVFLAPNVTDIQRTERPTKNGGVLSFVTVTVTFTVYGPDGSSIQCTTAGEAMDSGDKATNKAMSAAYKYAVMQLLAIPTVDGSADSEADTPQPAARKPATPATKPAPSPRPTAKAADGACIIEIVMPEPRTKTGDNAKGPWTRYYFSHEDVWYSTFSDTLGTTMSDLTGQTVEVTYTEGAKGRDLISVTPADVLDMGAAADPDKACADVPF